MGYITKYGSFWGLIPQTSGRVFWVANADSYTVEGRTQPASDNNDGLSPERAVRTIDYAVGLTSANVGDVIVLLPGSHTVTATVTVDVAGITIVGIPGNSLLPGDRANSGASRARSQITTSEAAGIIFTVTAADVEIAYLHFNAITQGQCVSISNAADRAFVHDCTFAVVGTASSTSYAINFPLGTGTTTNNDNSVIRNCYFLVSGNQGPAVRAVGTCIGLRIESSTFELQGTAAWDDAIESTLVGTLGLHIRDCDFLQPTSATTVITDAIDVTGMTIDGSTQVYRCYFPTGCDAIEATATPDVVVAECYLADTTSGAVTGSA